MIETALIISKNLTKRLPRFNRFQRDLVKAQHSRYNLARVYAAQLNHEFTHNIQSLHNGLIASDPEQAAGKIIQTFIQNWDQVKQRYAHKTLNQRTFNSKNAWGKDVGLTFSELVKKYLEDCLSDKHNTRFHKERTYELFEDLMGKTPVHSITKNKARHFKSLLMKIPCNANYPLKICSAFFGYVLRQWTSYIFPLLPF